MIQFDEDKQDRKLGEFKRREELELSQMLAARMGLEFVDLTTTPVNTDALRLITESEAREGRMAAFGTLNKQVKVAVISPEAEATKLVFAKLKGQGYEAIPFITTTASLDKAWNEYKSLSFASETKAGALDIANDEITTIITKVRSLPDVQYLVNELLTQKKGFRISRILEIVIAGALATGASDVHVEPEEGYVRLRFRLDGVLTDVTNFDHETYNLLLSRVKLLSGLKLNVKKEAQDGRFSVKLHDFDIEIRTSILPGAYSESIVLRVLNPKSIAVPLEELGIPAKLMKILEKETSRPNGMILTTGPTGSGKTTTLYAFLRKVYNPGVKVITIEDPIEYHLPGIVQTQTNEKGYDFLEGLRSALRQDPDIIMVGEIRDGETAKIAINSAQTGHLVFSTLHTNNAAGTFPRLYDLGIDPKVMTSAINITLAQRLVRKLCTACRKEVTIEGENKALVDRIVADIPEKDLVKQTAAMWTAVGCDACNKTGYKGRIGIYEAILTDNAIEEIVRLNPSEREIAKAARAQGILTMAEDGIVKVLTGLTSLDELGRVIDLDDINL
jgi:type IV pilus assembly protein PilB